MKLTCSIAFPAPGFACPRGRSYLGWPRLVTHFQGAILLGLALVISFKDLGLPLFRRGLDPSPWSVSLRSKREGVFQWLAALL
jgi:hypothetical protein